MNGTYVMTVMYDGAAFGTVTVKIVGDQQTITITFVGDYTGTVVIAVGDTVELPTAPEGYYYTFLVNGVEINSSTVFTSDTTITVVLHEIQVEPTGLLGDVNCDDVVDMRDVTTLNAYLMNCGLISEQGLANADVSGDGVIDAYDSTLIAKLALGM